LIAGPATSDFVSQTDYLHSLDPLMPQFVEQPKKELQIWRRRRPSDPQGKACQPVKQFFSEPAPVI
jgi:hypothetical protein